VSRDGGIVSSLGSCCFRNARSLRARSKRKTLAGVTEEQTREVAREFCGMLMRTDGREADKQLDAHLRYFRCSPDQLEAWRAHIKAIPLGALACTENED
jgi:hypothetical protein